MFIKYILLDWGIDWGMYIIKLIDCAYISVIILIDCRLYIIILIDWGLYNHSTYSLGPINTFTSRLRPVYRHTC